MAMDRIEKALQKLTPRERRRIAETLERIEQNQWHGLDMKKLKSRHDIFRVRKGNIRIIFRMENKQAFILAIERRSKDTYK